MKVTLVSLLMLTLISSCRGDQTEDSETYLSHLIADLWLEGTDIVRIIWRECSKKLVNVKDAIDRKEYFPNLVRCMKRKTLRVLDRSLNSDIVPVAEGVNLVRFELVDQTGNIMPENTTSTWTDKELDENEWRHLALRRIAKVLRTHVVKFDFYDTKTLDKVEYRGRRRHQMMTMMMFGIVSIGMVLIPMGFQFLAVLGGKALLLAKMALILASIQGLKKIASSPLNYGFYHAYPYDYEKRSNDDLSSGVLSMQSPTMFMRRASGNLILAEDKTDKLQTAKTNNENFEENKRAFDAVVWKPDALQGVNKKSAVFFSTFPRISSTLFANIDVPTTLVELTTKPSAVQADYSLDLPYNRLHFQSTPAMV